MNPARRKERKRADPRMEVEGLRIRLEEAEETLRAIRKGEVDGLLVRGREGEQVYTLKGADESYRTLVEAMNEGAMILDAHETVLYGNRRLAEILGIPLSKVIGARPGDWVPPGLQGAWAALIVESQSGPRSQELTLLRADRTLVPVQVSVSPASFDGFPGLCVLVSDLTDQKRRQEARSADQRAAQDEIQRHAKALEASNLELEAFIYSVSHDLRAPLRHIHRFSTMVEEDYARSLDPEGRELLKRIGSSAEHMDRLIGGLLDYSRLSRGEIALQSLDTGLVVQDVLKHLAADVEQSGAEISIEEQMVPVSGDPLLLSQAVSNLIANAIKFVPAGSRPKIRLRTEDRGGTVRLWVEDRGIGISLPSHQNKLFRVFERLAGEAYPGTGIGLAIVKRAVDRMGGAVGVESEVGNGSRFWIELRKPWDPST